MLKRVLLAGLALVGTFVGCELTNQGYAPQQPTQYSHAVHAGAMKIPCLYCHFGAKRGRYAGIPPAAICMNCHKQVIKDNPEILAVAEAIKSGEPIKWIRVHRVPDHVYFNHKVHAKGGVTCQQCHGPIESQGVVSQWAPLTMGWCLDCHRTANAPDPNVAAAGNVVVADPLTDCGVCHH